MIYNADEYNNSELFADVPGSYVSEGSLSESTCKSLITQAGPGAHVRTNGKQHSMVVAYVDDNGFAVLDSNGTTDAYINDLRYYTWHGYVTSYGKRGFEYIKVYSP